MKISSIIIGLLFLISTIQNSGIYIVITTTEEIIEDSQGTNNFLSEKYSDSMEFVVKFYKKYEVAPSFTISIKGFSTINPSDEEFETDEGWTYLTQYKSEETDEYIKYAFPFEPSENVKSLGYKLQNENHNKIGVYVTGQSDQSDQSDDKSDDQSDNPNSGKSQRITIVKHIACICN